MAGNGLSEHDLNEFSRPRQQRSSMKQVAERAGVAISSVSRVLSDDPNVSPLMRNRVLDAVAALGYERDPLARSMRTGSTYSVGFVAVNIANPVVAAYAAGAEEELRSAGYSLLISNSHGEPSLDAAYLRYFDLRRVDGLLLSLADETNPETLAIIRDLSEPIVLLDRSLTSDINVGAVLHDHRTGVTQAVQHLLGLGHTRFALVNGAPRVRPSRERASAMRFAIKGVVGVTCSVRAGAYSAEHGCAATMALMRENPTPTVIFVGGNQILTGVLQALRDIGARIPEDISLVTFDAIPLAPFLEPPLATIVREAEAAGERAAQLLLEQIQGGVPRTIVLPTAFLPAASCGPAPSHTFHA
jgi:LacI family transcriptional regulator